MVSFLKGRRRTDDAVVAVDSSGSHITLALEALVARAEQALEQLRALTPVLERSEDLNTLRERCESVEQTVAGMEGTSARLTAAEAQVARVATAGTEIDQLQARLGEFGDKIDAALKLREQIEGFLGLEDPIARGQRRRRRASQAARGDGRGRDPHADPGRRRPPRAPAQHLPAGGVRRGVPGRHRPPGRSRRAGCRRSSGRSSRWARPSIAVPDVQHRLAVLKALADQVSQKSAALEQQREAVDRAATQISQLTRLDRELDAWLRRQEEQIRRFGAIEAKIAEVQAVQVQGAGAVRGAAGHGAADRGSAAGCPAVAQRSPRADAEEQRELRAGEPGPARGERAGRRPPERGQGVRDPLRGAGCGEPGHRRR